MVLYLCVLIVFSLRRESLKLIQVMNPLPEVVLSQVLGKVHLVALGCCGKWLLQNHLLRYFYFA
jgi:hypothetical protein